VDGLAGHACQEQPILVKELKHTGIARMGLEGMLALVVQARLP